MKRSSITLNEIADFRNLAHAFHLAAKGKRQRQDVLAFAGNLEDQLACLRRSILDDSLTLGSFTSFRIYDPKPRTIQAPAFRERVLHHALMARLGPVIDRGLVADAYACRQGRGPLRAVQRAQHHARRFPWFCQVDIRAYYASIDHDALLAMLGRRFKDRRVLALLAKLIAAAPSAPGKGLPIGALTSQYLANLYLGPVDRLILEQCRAAGYVRYMDDLVWWGRSRSDVRRVLEDVQQKLTGDLKLELKAPIKVGRSADGLCFCGYRILLDRLLLSRRRKQRYIACKRRWEKAFAEGVIDARTLQARYASAFGMTAHADAKAWRHEQLARDRLALGELEA